MSPTLQVLTGNNAGAKYELVQDKLRLGRHPDCEVHIDANAVSRYHAHLIRDAVGYAVEDLQSRNGTYVNGKRIEQKTILKDNDRLKICDTLFVFRTGAKPALANAPPSSPVAAEEERDSATTVLTTIDAGDSGSEMMVKVQAEAKLRAILEISQAIGQTLELDRLFPKILDSLFKIFPHSDRALILVRDQQDRLVPRAVKHRRESEDTVRFSRTIVRQAMNDRKAILSADAASDSRFSMSESIADFRIRSVMCVPLLAQDKTPLGVIQIDTQSQGQRFDEEDLQILASVASQASISIENASLHAEQLQQERIQRELSFAKEVQHGFLPASLPKLNSYEFWAYYEAAGQVGGDFYDFMKLPDGRQAVILGDVAGKGVPAALMMAKATSDTKVALLTATNAGEAMGMINNAICAAGLEGKFITMALCIIDPKANKLEMVNAGHMSPMVRRADGSVEEPADQRVSGLPVGVMEDFEYESAEIVLEPGDSVIVFSDGISEAMNAANQMYSIERLRQKLQSVSLPAPKLGEFLLNDVRGHVAGHRQSDDISFLVFARTPA